MVTTFTIDQKRLFSVLSSMQPICTKRTTLDATSSILFQVGHKELILKGTDLETQTFAQSEESLKAYNKELAEAKIDGNVPIGSKPISKFTY